MRNQIFATTLAAAACFAQSASFDAFATLSGGELADFRDSTPDPDGNTIYFTAIGPAGAGVFRVPASGGVASTVFAGAPLVNPTGIAMSNDGRTLYVADPLVYAGPRRTGAIFALPVAGGRPLVVRGSEGRAPHGIDVDPSREVLFFTGTNLITRKVGVYRLPAEGSDAPERVAEGFDIVDPDSVTVARDGTVYVTDRGGRSGYGSVLKIADSEVSTILDIMRPGQPAGLALSLDESTLLVSTLQPYRDRAQVLVVRLDTLETFAETRVVGANQGPGGLHRARNGSVFSWCGQENNVYRVRP